MGYINVFSNPYKFTESWSAQGAVVRFGIEGGDNNLTAAADESFSCSYDPAGEKCPLIISGINLTYTRQSQQIYPLTTDENGDATKVVVKGAPQGILALTSIYSPVAASITCFLKLASRDCVAKGNEMWMSLRPFGALKNCMTGEVINASEAPNKITWRISGVEMNQLGLQMQSGPTTIVSMPLNFEFTDLKISDNGDFGNLNALVILTWYFSPWGRLLPFRVPWGFLVIGVYDGE